VAEGRKETTRRLMGGVLQTGHHLNPRTLQPQTRQPSNQLHLYSRPAQ